MDGIKTLVIILILLIVVIVTLQSKAKKKHIKSRTKKKYANDETSKDTLSTPEPVGEDIDVKQAYTPKWLFSMNEKRAYYKLNDIAKKHNLVVFAKVRLLDLVTPQRNNPKYKTCFYKIQAKHVDFVLAKENLVAKYIIELDDSSHDTPDRTERDQFVDAVVTACGYKILHTREINEDEIEQFLDL